MLKTNPMTPQRNGDGERMNKTLNERAKNMRIHARLPKTFWANLVSTAAYLINRGASAPIRFKILEDEWQDQDVSFSHIKVFCCVSYVHVRDVDRASLMQIKKVYFH